ncbi:MAG: lipid-A-disaccharide synthase [Pigmentiphaga sp.]
MVRDPLRIACVTGEPSGDLLAALVAAGIREQAPEAVFEGIGGPRLLEQGFNALYPMSKLAVNGYAEVLMHLPELLSIRRHLKQHWSAHRPAVMVGVDAPDFNFNLELHLRRQGVPTVHFIGPSLWAWRGERMRQIREAVSRMLVVFPFETVLYQEAGVPVSYVGHPLASVVPMDPDRAAARTRLGLDQAARVLALMPGSRASEVRQLGSRFLAAAQRLQRKDPGLQIVAPMANAERQAEFLAQARQLGLNEVLCPIGGSHDALAACNAVMVASGTATLEAALFKRPMVISYVLSRLSYWIMKRQAYLPWVGLPNILCRDFVVPELLQDAATPVALAEAGWQALTDERQAQRLYQRFSALHDTLRRDTPALAAQAILEVANRGA